MAAHTGHWPPTERKSKTGYRSSLDTQTNLENSMAFC